MLSSCVSPPLVFLLKVCSSINLTKCLIIGCQHRKQKNNQIPEAKEEGKKFSHYFNDSSPAGKCFNDFFFLRYEEENDSQRSKD